MIKNEAQGPQIMCPKHPQQGHSKSKILTTTLHQLSATLTAVPVRERALRVEWPSELWREVLDSGTL